MPLVSQGLGRLFFFLWLNFLTGACMSNSFVILFINLLYDRSTSCLQSENKLSQSIFLGLKERFVL